MCNMLSPEKFTCKHMNYFLFLGRLIPLKFMTSTLSKLRSVAVKMKNKNHASCRLEINIQRYRLIVRRSSSINFSASGWFLLENSHFSQLFDSHDGLIAIRITKWTMLYRYRNKEPQQHNVHSLKL